jgi:hypothetical protein
MVEGTHHSMKVGIFAALLILVFVVIVGIDAYQKIRRQPGPPSTYNAASAGYKALYLWLRELGVPAKRWESPLTELPREAGVLLMMSPRLGPGPGEVKALEKWVRDGGTLVLVSSPWNAFAEPFGFEMKMRPLDSGHGLRPRALARDGVRNEGEPSRGRPERSAAESKGDEVGAPGSARGDPLHDQKKEEESPSFQPGPYIRGQRTIKSKIHPGIDSQRPEAIVHARDAFGNLIVAVEERRGRVIMIADPSLFSNLHLREGDHARLALDLLLTHLGEGVLLIDEYHHGYGRVTSVAAYLFQSEAFVPMLQAMFLLLMLWAAAGRRFGPPRPLPRETERSSMEYARAMAQLFQRVKARRLALESVLHWFDEETRRLLLDKDPALQRDMAEAKKRLSLGTTTDRDLVNVVRKLYGALARVRRQASGGKGAR